MARGRRRTLPTAVIGTGRLATALLPLLGPAGYPVAAVAARRLASARAACRGLCGAQATTSPAVAAGCARLVLLAVPDGRLAELAGRLASRRGLDWDDRIVLHHAGALGLEPLEPLASRGAAVGLLHPLQTLGTPRLAAKSLRGSRARVEGDALGEKIASKLARDLGMTPIRLPGDPGADGRAAYHAAASLVSNDLLALLDLGVELLESTGLSGSQALEALVPLARGTLEQAAEEGPEGALTGPVARGDVGTLRTHLERLAAISTGDAEVHRLLSLRLTRLARRLGRPVSPATTRALRRNRPRGPSR